MLKSMRWIVVAALVTGCTGGDPESLGFSLPEGDPASGEWVYRDLACNVCHTVEGVEQEPLAYYPGVSIPLGGDVTRIKTYGDLVTSVVNPSHRIARSADDGAVDELGDSVMPVYNEVMTVGQLVDLIAFLKSKYRLKPHPVTQYRMYYPTI